MSDAVTSAGAGDVASYRHGHVPREVRLRQVLELGEALFAERGYRGASMDELARRAGVSKPVIYDLVASKDELFRTLMTRTSDELTARVTEAVHNESDPYRRLAAGARAWFGFVADHRAIWAAFLAGEDAPLGTEVAAIRRRQAAVVAELLGESREVLGHRAGELLLGALAHLVNGAFEALGAWWGDHPEVGPEALAELCASVVYPGLVALGGDVPEVWAAR